ncbi:MAG TPA: hypothetical protein VJR90_01480 [Gammaproteobacteria bacterium]|nr:hypothetical protein [Gammaproteobacteria bacterium]
MKIAMLIPALACALLLTACIPVPLQHYDNMPAVGFENQPLDIKQLERAIYVGAYNEGWTAVTVAPGHIVATHVETPRSVSVDILYDAHTYSIHYKNTQDMNYDAATGKIDPRYNRWTADLRDSINAAMRTMCSAPSACVPQ